MRHVRKWLSHGAEAIAAAMLAGIFGTFLAQIFSRYVMAEPFNWTLELCLTLWVWAVFFGAAFVVRERDHVTFDILYLAAPPAGRKIMAMISAAAITLAMLVAFWPTWEYIDFLRIRKSATLKIEMRLVFSIYAVFMLAIAARYAWRLYDSLKNGPPEDDNELAELAAKGSGDHEGAAR